jgi:D-aspartate ligase
MYPATLLGKTPVIAMGGGVTLATVLRHLHRAGIPTYSICTPEDFVRHSRWHRPVPGAWPAPTPRSLQKFLECLSLERAVLLPCSDDWLSATAALPPELARRFPSSVAPSGVVETMVDKWRFAQLLQRHGIPRPRTSLLTSRDFMDSLSAEDFEGAILKPLSSVTFATAYGVKGFLVGNRAEARRAMAGVEFPILLQEFIPGPPAAGHFVEGFIDRNGRVCAMFARRRLRMYPPRLGNSTFMVSVPLEEVSGAVAPLQYLLQAIDYRGVFSAEFKYDERDRFFKLLEINARPWWYVDAPARAGIDVCRMAYHDALHQAVEPRCSYFSGQYLGFLPNDFRAWSEERRAGGPTLWSWLGSWRHARSTPFYWDDPLPALAFAWKQFSNIVVQKRRQAAPLKRGTVPGPSKRVNISTDELVARR